MALFLIAQSLIKKLMEAIKDTSKPGHTHSSKRKTCLNKMKWRVSDPDQVLWVRIKLMSFKI